LEFVALLPRSYYHPPLLIVVPVAVTTVYSESRYTPVTPSTAATPPSPPAWYVPYKTSTWAATIHSGLPAW